VKSLILEAEADFMAALRELETRVSHLPSRLRSLLWIACVAPKLTALGESAPDGAEVMEHLIRRLPAATKPPRTELREALVELHENAV
jgi:hypothetical protein